MNSFRKWNGKKIEDWGSIMSDDAKSFYRAFKNYLKREFPNAELIGFKPNHYDFSGFINQDGKYIYISHDIDRSKERVDFNDSSVSSGVLYRTATGPKDYRGGSNNFCSINRLADCVKALFDRMPAPETESANTKGKMLKEDDEEYWNYVYSHVYGVPGNEEELEKAADYFDVSPSAFSEPYDQVFGDEYDEAKSLTEKLYSMDEVQDMLTACKKDKALAKDVISKIKGSDGLAVSNVISDGWYETFFRYDSAVMDKFITAYLQAKGLEESVKAPSMEMYKGYEISYNFYGNGEYTVFYDGDDVWFRSEKAAKDFIDGIDSGEVEESVGVNEVSGYKTYEIMQFYNVSFKKDLTPEDLEQLANDLTNVKEPEIGCSVSGSGLKLDTYWRFSGKIDWDEDGGQWFWTFDGAPDNTAQDYMVDKIKDAIVFISNHLSTKLDKDDIVVEHTGMSIEDAVAELVDTDESNFEYEGRKIVRAVRQVMEGKTLLSVLKLD